MATPILLIIVVRITWATLLFLSAFILLFDGIHEHVIKAALLIFIFSQMTMILD